MNRIVSPYLATETFGDEISAIPGDLVRAYLHGFNHRGIAPSCDGVCVLAE